MASKAGSQRAVTISEAAQRTHSQSEFDLAVPAAAYDLSESHGFVGVGLVDLQQQRRSDVAGRRRKSPVAFRRPPPAMPLFGARQGWHSE